MLQIQFTIEVPIKLQRRKAWFLASCNILDIHTQGETEQMAKDNLGEAIALFITSCFERGTLDAVLKQCGFKLGGPQRKIAPIKNRPEILNIPIPFWVNNNAGYRSCHA